MQSAETVGMMVIVAGLGSIATWYASDRTLEARLEAFAAHRPPVAVIDYSAVYDALKAGVPQANLNIEFERIGAAGDRLAKAGYLVFTSAQVVKVPEGSLVSAPPIAAPTNDLHSGDQDLDLGAVVNGLANGQKGQQ